MRLLTASTSSSTASKPASRADTRPRDRATGARYERVARVTPGAISRAASGGVGRYAGQVGAGLRGAARWRACAVASARSSREVFGDGLVARAAGRKGGDIVRPEGVVMILGRLRGHQDKGSLGGALVKGGLVVVKAGKLLLALASFAAYAFLFTWQFAVIIVGMLVIHECGHLEVHEALRHGDQGTPLPLTRCSKSRRRGRGRLPPSRRAEATIAPGRATDRGRAGGRDRAGVLRHPERGLRRCRCVDGADQPVQPAAGGAARRRPGGEVDHLFHRLTPDGAGRGHRRDAG